MKLPKLRRNKPEEKFLNKNYKLYKEQKTLDFSKKRKSLGLKIKLSESKRNYKKIALISILVLFLLALAVLAFIMRGPVFRVQPIQIFKNDGFVDITIAYKSMEDFRDDLIFSITPEEVLEKVTNYQETIETISLKKIYPNTLELYLSSYEPAFNIIIKGKKYVLLSNGSIVPVENYPDDLMILGVENNFESSHYLSYKKIYEAEKIEKIQVLIQKAAQNIVGSITANYYEHERELHLVFNNTTIVMFSLDDDISVDEQIQNLAIMNKESDAIVSGKNMYVDLRIKGKAFICPYANEANCAMNLSFLYPQVDRPEIEPATID